MPPGVSPGADDSLTSLQWLLEVYPLLVPEMRPIELLQEPGEVVWVPGGEWQGVEWQGAEGKRRQGRPGDVWVPKGEWLGAEGEGQAGWCGRLEMNGRGSRREDRQGGA